MTALWASTWKSGVGIVGRSWDRGYKKGFGVRGGKFVVCLYCMEYRVFLLCSMDIEWVLGCGGGEWKGLRDLVECYRAFLFGPYVEWCHKLAGRGGKGCEMKYTRSHGWSNDMYVLVMGISERDKMNFEERWNGILRGFIMSRVRCGWFLRLEVESTVLSNDGVEYDVGRQLVDFWFRGAVARKGFRFSLGTCEGVYAYVVPGGDYKGRGGRLRFANGRHVGRTSKLKFVNFCRGRQLRDFYFYDGLKVDIVMGDWVGNGDGVLFPKGW